jgi:hypothetical protein
VGQVRRARDTRQAEAIVGLAKGYRDLLASLDRDYIQSDQFKTRCLAILEEAALARNDAKRAEYVAAGLNLALNPKGPDEFDLFLATLSRVESIHIRLLAGLAGSARDPNATGGMGPLTNAIVDLTPIWTLRSDSGFTRTSRAWD